MTGTKSVGVNLRGVFVATKLAIPHLKQSKFGRIIQIASVHAYGGGAGPAYAPAKAAVVNMVRDTALEIGQDGITVNALCPGYIETAIQDYLTPEQIEEALEKTALPRFGLPRDIGRAAVFLASDDAEWITGASSACRWRLRRRCIEDHSPVGASCARDSCRTFSCRSELCSRFL